MMKSPNPIFSARGSERLVCIWALQDDRWLQDLPVVLTRLHFEDQRYGALFEAIVDSRARGIRPTPDTLEAWAENSGVWEPNDLFKLNDEGRCGSAEEFAAAAANVVRNAGGRLVRERIQDADAYVLENTSEDPAVLLTNIEGLFRATAVEGQARSVSIGDMSRNFLDTLKAGDIRGLRTGYIDLDARHGSFLGGELIVIAGETASGKTTLATNISRRLSERGAKGHFASYEMGQGQIISRMWSAISYETPEIEAFEYNALRKEGRGGVAERTLDDCDAILRDRYGSLRIDVRPAQTLAELEASVRNTKRELGGLDFIVVDYLQRMRPMNPKLDQHLRIAEISAGLKTLAQRHDVPVFALSTINRENQKRGDKRPQRSDLRESGSIEYDADAILGVYRPAREIELELRAMEINPDTSDEAFFTKQGELEKVKHVLELLSLKVRMGEEGTDYLRCNLGFDTVRDGERPRTARAVR